MTSEGRAQKFHTDDVLLLRSGWCFWLVYPGEKFASTNQKHYRDLGCDACSMEFLHSFLAFHFAGNQWWRLERSAVFSGLFYRPSTQRFCHFLNIIIKKKKPTINFQNVPNCTGSRYFREAMEFWDRRKPHISITFLHIWIFVSSIMPPDTQKTPGMSKKQLCRSLPLRIHTEIRIFVKGLYPGSFKSWLSLMVWVNVVLNRTVVVDNDWRFDNLCGSHRQSQIKETKTKFLLIQSTLALRTPRYNGHPDNTDGS